MSLYRHTLNKFALKTLYIILSYIYLVFTTHNLCFHNQVNFGHVNDNCHNVQSCLNDLWSMLNCIIEVCHSWRLLIDWLIVVDDWSEVRILTWGVTWDKVINKMMCFEHTSFSEPVQGVWSRLLIAMPFLKICGANWIRDGHAVITSGSNSSLIESSRYKKTSNKMLRNNIHYYTIIYLS